MTPITVVIRLTGLLLFTSGPGENAPTYVLFPTTSPGMETHIAQIGFRQRMPTADCDTFQNRFGEHVCYVNIANTSITLGRPGNAMRTMLPRGDISAAAGRKVAPGHFTESQVPESLHTRLILNAGQQDSTCALGLFRFAGEPRVPISNAVYWSYTDPDGPSLTVTATPLRAGATRREFTVYANEDRKVELFVRYVPRSEQGHVITPPQLPSGEEAASHYSEFYKLLETQPDPLEIPVFTEPNPQVSRCVWAEPVAFESFRVAHLGHIRVAERPVRVSGLASPPIFTTGTLTCTVGKGDPPGGS